VRAPARGSLGRRLHSLSGVVPVGAFLVLHLYANTAARRGADAYNAMARRLHETPLLLAVEVLAIAAPLFFHGIYGLFLIAEGEPKTARPATAARRALTAAQRATGVGLFAFVLLHLWTARLVQIRDHESLDLFRLMQAVLASPWLRAAYVVGLLAATFHFSAGLWTFAETWGLAATARSRRIAAAASAGVFAALSAMGLAALSAFRL
jgi:succinate dehydrogenase / fumarate reductase cytochrome b subunit